MKLVQEATHHFMFQEFWASHYPLVQALSIFPNSELVVMVHTAHPRYTSGWASSAKANLGAGGSSSAVINARSGASI
jgi:hypothetical protein